MSVTPCQSSACKRSADQANDVLSYMATLASGFRGACAAELGGDVWVPPEWSGGGTVGAGSERAPGPKAKGCQKQGPGCASAACNACADEAVEVIDYMASLGDGIVRATPEGVLASRMGGGCRSAGAPGFVGPAATGALEKRDVRAAAGGANAGLHARFRELDSALPVPPEDPPADAPCGVGRVKCGVSGRIASRANAVLVGLAEGPLFDAQKAIIDAMYERQAAEFCGEGCGVYGSCEFHTSSVEFVFGDEVNDDGSIEHFAAWAYFWECCCETSFHDPPLPPRWDPGDLPWDDDPADTEGSGA